MAFPKNHIPWNKGLHIQLTDDLTGLEIGHQKGEKHHLWKGDFASYSALHYWIQREIGKAHFCLFNKNHVSTRYHWANISKIYKRDVTDYMPLCPSCHFKYDNVGEKMWQTRRGGVLLLASI